jgi:hypothetical protein
VHLLQSSLAEAAHKLRPDHVAQSIDKQSLWSDRRRCADRGLGCVFIKTRSSEPQAEGSRS